MIDPDWDPYDLLQQHEEHITKLMRAVSMIMQSMQHQQEKINELESVIINMALENHINQAHDK